MSGAEHTLVLDWRTPPLTENQRLHFHARARLVRDVRSTTALWGRRIRGADRVEVRLIWVVADRRRRDEDNVVPTLKALCDGLVDAGVVPDDTPAFMVKLMPVIEYRAGSTPHLELRVSVVPANLD